jgi:hypothetical protein
MPIDGENLTRRANGGIFLPVPDPVFDPVFIETSAYSRCFPLQEYAS